MSSTGMSLTRRVFVATLLPLPAFAKKRNRKENKKRQTKQETQPLALIEVSVFQPGGRSFPGAKIRAVSLANPKVKFDGVANHRGELALRVPAPEQKFKVAAEAKGLEPVEREVEVYEAQKTTVNLMFEAPTK